jgi:hypothetical protein
MAADGGDSNDEHGRIAADRFSHDLSGSRKQSVFDHSFVAT